MREYKYCLRCGRRLKSEEARQIGFGKVCLKRAEQKAVREPLIKP